MSEQSAAPAGAQTPQLTNGWNLFVPSLRAIARNFWTIVGLFAIPLGGFLLTVGVLFLVEKTHTPATAATIIGLAFGLASAATFLVVLPASTLALLAGARGESVEIKEMWVSGRAFVLPYLLVSALLVMLYGAGLIFLIIPYFFAMKYFMLAPYYVLDEGVSAMEAMRRSAAAAKKHSKAMWTVVAVVATFNVIEFVPYAGLPVSIVLSLMYAAAPAIRYLEIHAADANEPMPKLKHEKKKSPFEDQFDGKSTVD
ncbi:MAG TPA: hypothetical protein VIM53_01815 [Candidatus Saccharimonadales bacterium]